MKENFGIEAVSSESGKNGINNKWSIKETDQYSASLNTSASGDASLINGRPSLPWVG